MTALAGNNLAGALASGASPYLATEIKKRVGENNIAANAMAHAVLGAVTAQLNNQSAAAGDWARVAGSWRRATLPVSCSRARRRSS